VRRTLVDHTTVPLAPLIRVQPSVWAKAGTINDGIGDQILELWWKPDSDQVRVQKPKVYVPPSPPCIVGDPLYQTDSVFTAAANHPFTAQAGYIYCFEEKEYSAKQAEELTARLGTIKGWTWRKE
jgi:hypothetical protein